MKTTPDQEKKLEKATAKTHASLEGESREEHSAQMPAYVDSITPEEGADNTNEKYRGGLIYWAGTNAIDCCPGADHQKK